MANEKNGITEPENKTTNQAIVIPLLEPEDIDVKIKQVKDTGALALLYKTARTDMDILDRVFGAMNWMDSYQEIKGNLYCTISIWDAHKQMWIAKQDCGIESREDGEGNEKKGEASDAFKRASTRFGIGRELYTSPFIWLNVETKQDNKGNWVLADKFAKFVVKDIGYDNRRRITRLVIANAKNGDVVYRYGVGSDGSNGNKNQKRQTPKNAEQPKTTPKQNASVEKTSTLPQGELPEWRKAYNRFVEDHDLSNEQFVIIRAKAVKAGKHVTQKSFQDLTPDEWIEMINALETLYVEGFFDE